jgi:hypothetical protein
MSNYSDAIHNAIIARVRATTFYQVSYSKTWVRTTSEVTTATPGSIFCQPETSSFQTAAEGRRAYERERGDWVWILDVIFSKKVNLEPLEDSLKDDPIVIPRSGTLTHQVIVDLEDATYEVPPLGQGASGTRARLRLIAALSPK